MSCWQLILLKASHRGMLEKFIRRWRMKISPFIFESITPTNKQVHGMNSHICDQSMGVFCIELWLVGGGPTPLKNDGVRQLGWLLPIIMESHKIHVPVTTNQMGLVPVFCDANAWHLTSQDASQLHSGPFFPASTPMHRPGWSSLLWEPLGPWVWIKLDQTDWTDRIGQVITLW